jgi:hypothetical protein
MKMHLEALSIHAKIVPLFFSFIEENRGLAQRKSIG